MTSNIFSIKSPSSTSVFERGTFRQTRKLVQEVDRHWRAAVIERLNHLVSLQRGWDGYDAPAVKFDTASFALRLLESAFDEDAPAPQIVPGSNGGLQLEWHLPSGDLELDVEAPYRVHAWYAADGDAQEVNLTNDFTIAATWLSELTEEPLATAATA